MCKKLMCFSCFGLVLVLTLTNAADAQDPNLLGWWKLDEKSGNIAYDSSGNENHGELIQNDGTPISDPEWVSGYAGGALWLDGVDDFVEVPHDESLWPGTEATLMAWINTPRSTGAGGSSWQAIITKGNDPRMCSLYTTTDDRGRAVLHFSVGVNFTGSISMDPIPLNEWVHVCGMLQNGTHLYYINGEPSQPDVPGEGSVIAYGTETLRIGSAPELNGFLGRIDDVRIYNGALSQEEIQLIMVSGLSPAATAPNPDNETQEVARDIILSWREGQFSDTHNVYFGTDFNDVEEASVSEPMGTLVAENQEDTTFDPLGTDLLEFKTVYYWRVDEINDSEPNSPWKGDVWSFTTRDFLLVDDFESYNDVNNMIYDIWSDYAVNNTGMTVGHIEPPSAERTIIRSGKQSMPLHYDNDGTVNEGTSIEVSGTLLYSEAERWWADPQDWTRDAVESLTIWFRGYPAKVSSFVEEPAGIFTVKGIGRDIWARADEFHFAFKEISGGGKIIAKVDSLENTDPFARAGVMIRDTLDANAKYCAVFMTPENGVRFQYRTGVNFSTDRQFDPNVAVPYWIRLERSSGGLVRAYYSETGEDEDWEAFTATVVTMTNPIYIGLAVTSHDAFAACEATFSNVSFPDTAIDPEWTAQDVGVITNEAEPMYVAVSDGTSEPAVVYHEDPNAALIDTWTEWAILLQEFEDQGVDLTKVKSLAIGFGDRDNPQLGGSGNMYFDDIRLYRHRCIPNTLTLWEADLNIDCVVDFRDLEIISGQWLQSGPDLTADISADSAVDFEDYAVLANQWLDE